MTPFTLVLAYYDNPGMLLKQIRTALDFPEPMRQALHMVVVDDGSPRWPALSAVTRPEVAGFADLIAGFQLWRMLEDVPWNQDACRNLGVKNAPTKWVLLTDMDHIVPAVTWHRLMAYKLKKEYAYRFARVSAPDMKPYKLHPNSWALTRDTFWKCGGYDETLAGNYGTDGDFGRRLEQVVAKVHDLPEHLIRYPREVIPDASTTTLERKRPEQKQAIHDLIRARRNVPNWRPRVLSFPNERVL